MVIVDHARALPSSCGFPTLFIETLIVTGKKMGQQDFTISEDVRNFDD
jgi:hypothetical protein